MEQLLADLEQQVARIEASGLEAIDEQCQLFTELRGMQKLAKAYDDFETASKLFALEMRAYDWLQNRVKI